ncbi:MAG: efflux RND transporter permease subunit, partial [Anaerolineae bacterium]
MLQTLIDRLTRASLRFKWVTIVLAIVALVAGVIALVQLNQELIPSIEFPTTIIVALNSGMEPEDMRDEVTIPIEDAVKDIEGVVNVESTTSSGVSVVQVQSEFGLDMEDFRGEIQAAYEALSYPEGMETPELLTFGMDDLPAVYGSISSDELSLSELKVLVESDILPVIDEIPGVAAVQISGGQELPTEQVAAVEPTPTEEPTATPTMEPSPTPTTEPTATPTEVPPTPTAEEAAVTELEEPEPVDLPESWVQAAAAQGMTLTTTADLTAQMVTAIAGMAPQMLDELTPEMLLAMQLDALAALPEEYVQSIDAELQAQLAERADSQGAVEEETAAEPEPVVLPESWVQAAAAQGMTLTTTADLTAQMVTAIAGMAPQMLDELTPEMLLAMPLDALAALPEEYVQSIDAELQAQLAERADSEGAVEEETAAEPEPVALPESWVQAAAAQGMTLTTTADLTAQMVTVIAGMAPQMLDELTPEMLLAMPLDALAAVPEEYIQSLDTDLQAQLAERAAAAVPPEEEAAAQEGPVPLPESWTEGAAGWGVKLETTDDLTPLIMRNILSRTPEALAELTPEMLLAMPQDVLEVLPEEYIESLDPELQA